MSSKKILILYYSRSGNTKKMAKTIAEAMKSSRGKHDSLLTLWLP